MGVMDGVRRYPRAAGVISLAVLIGAGVLMWSMGRPQAAGAPAGDAFYDETEGKFLRKPSSEIPPLAGSDGRLTVVRAALRREPPTMENTLYFFRFNDEGKKRVEEMVKGSPGGDFSSVIISERNGQEVRLPAPGSPWVGADTAEGQRIVGQ